MQSNMDKVSENVFDIDFFSWMLQEYPLEMLQAYNPEWIQQMTKQYKMLDLLGAIEIEEHLGVTLMKPNGRTHGLI